VATLAKRFGNLDTAEDAASQAFVTGAERWPVEGIPPNHGAWAHHDSDPQGDRPDSAREQPRPARILRSTNLVLRQNAW
jgi:predicted RNA polymerase sigma factor